MSTFGREPVTVVDFEVRPNVVSIAEPISMGVQVDTTGVAMFPEVSEARVETRDQATNVERRSH